MSSETPGDKIVISLSDQQITHPSIFITKPSDAPEATSHFAPALSKRVKTKKDRKRNKKAKGEKNACALNTYYWEDYKHFQYQKFTTKRPSNPFGFSSTGASEVSSHATSCTASQSNSRAMSPAPTMDNKGEISPNGNTKSTVADSISRA